MLDKSLNTAYGDLGLQYDYWQHTWKSSVKFQFVTSIVISLSSVISGVFFVKITSKHISAGSYFHYGSADFKYRHEFSMYQLSYLRNFPFRHSFCSLMSNQYPLKSMTNSDCASCSRKCQSYIITTKLVSILRGNLQGYFLLWLKVIIKQTQKQVSLLLQSAVCGCFIDHMYRPSVTCVCFSFLSVYFQIFCAEQDKEIVMHKNCNPCCKDGTLVPCKTNFGVISIVMPLQTAVPHTDLQLDVPVIPATAFATTEE